MSFIEEIKNLATSIEEQKDLIKIEAAAKQICVLPFINILGYNIRNLKEVEPEFTADTGIKQGEKVDYAIHKDNEVIMLIECKKYGDDLSDTHRSQLYRYFSVVSARIAILTDGVLYKFYTDIEETNKMDETPFLELNLLNIQDSEINELKQFTKLNFNLTKILAAANELKYANEIKQVMLNELNTPSEDFIRFLLANVYDGIKTQQVIQTFTNIVRKALYQFASEAINNNFEFLRDVNKSENVTLEQNENITDNAEEKKINSPLVITDEEIIRAKEITNEILETITVKHTKNFHYVSISLDTNRKNWIYRLRFKKTRKQLEIKAPDKKAQKFGVYDLIEIDSIEALYNYAEQIKIAAMPYMNKQQEKDTEKKDKNEY